MSTIDQIASTPGFNAGSVDVQPSNTKVTKITKKVDNLQPGVTYTLLVRAKKNGQFSDYVSYQYTVPETDKSGNNFTVSNSNTDIQLLGGGFAASLSTDPLPINIGKINVTDTITAGTGVIMNQYGLAGYKAGTKTFYINARTGDAYFAGTLSASSITSGGGALSSDLASYAQVSALASYATKAGLGSTGYTTIHGGNITTGTITSSGYVDGTDPYFSSAGTGINLDSGTFRAKQFGIDSSGNVKFAGTITASATIGTTPASTVVANAAAGASALQSIPANYITTSTSISGGQITTGTIKNGAFPGTGSTQAADGSDYSKSGMAINLDNSSITSPYFTLSSTGASLKGSFKTGSGSNYIQIYDQGSYGEILFKSGALYTEGSIYGSTEQIFITSPIKSGYTGFSSIALGGESNVVNSRLSLQSGGYYIHLDAITGLDYIGPMVSAGAASTGLRKISVQNGGSASGGADGDIILIY